MKRPDDVEDLSRSAVRALRVVHKFGPVRPGNFARAMWPKGMMHYRSHSKGNNGASRGGSVGWVAGGYLGKLRRADLVLETFRRRYSRGYVLSEFGRSLLREVEGGEIDADEWDLDMEVRPREECRKSDAKW